MFDLPTMTAEQRANYRGFRKKLTNRGFDRMQLSVYGRPCVSEDAAQAHRKHIEAALPPGGEVRMLAVTDRQMANMLTFVRGKAKEPPRPAAQLALF